MLVVMLGRPIGASLFGSIRFQRNAMALTQAEIAAHLDMSERNVRELMGKLGLNHRRCSIDEIRIAYIRHLRELAAGRGGDDQFELTKQRARQAEADANLKELEYWTRVGALIAVDEIEPRLMAWAAHSRSEIEGAVEVMVDGVESKFSITIPRELVDKPMVAAYKAIAAYPSVVRDGDGEAETGVGH